MSGTSLELFIIGLLLIVGIFLYGWLDYRRTTRIGNFGLAMVKNRLSDTRQSKTFNPR